MNLKISLFNKSVIKSDFKRFWWVSALNTLAIFLFFTFIYLNEVKHGIPTPESKYIYTDIYRYGLLSMSFIFIFPVISAALLFSYLNSSNSVTCLHGLPVKRMTFFASHIISGVTLLIIPVVVNVLIMLAARINHTVAESYKLQYLFIWAGQYILYSVMAFNATAAVGMITGNSVAGIVFTYIIAGLPILTESFIRFFCEQQLYGCSVNFNEMLTKFLYVMPYEMYNNPWNILKYIIFSLIFLAVAYGLYKIRKLENNGEIVAFPKCRPLFTYGVAACAGAVGYAYFYSMWSAKSVLQLIPFGVVGIIAAEMIQKKTLKIKTAAKPAIIFCFAVCILQLALQLDIFGYERKIPAIESINTVTFEIGGIGEVNDRIEYTQDGNRIYYDNTDISIKTPEVIDSVVQLHKKIVKEKKEPNDIYSPLYFGLKYNLKNGKSISREYYADKDADKEYLEKIFESEEMKKMYFPVLDDIPKEVVFVEVNDQRAEDRVFEYYGNNSEEIQKIVEALKKDTAAVKYEEFADKNGTVTSIRIGYKRSAHYANGQSVEREKLPVQYETYYVRKSYSNVKEVLNELGVYTSIQAPEDIEYVGINYYSEEVTKTESSEVFYEKNSEISQYDKVINDINEMTEIYEYLSDELYTGNGEAVMKLKNGNNICFGFDLEADDLPEIMKNK